MVPKVLWVAVPLGLYAVYVVVAVALRRSPSRMVLNVHTSLLLLAYLLATAGLGIFWVANQQLPVFDWHYLFGYATVALVAVHLVFNLPLVVRSLRSKKRASKSAEGSTSKLLGGLGVGTAVVAAFLLGTRHGRSEVQVSWGDGHPRGEPIEAVVAYHEFSSASRAGVFARAPSIDWSEELEPFKRYPDVPAIELEGTRPPVRLGLSEAIRSPAPTRSLDRAALGAILFHAAGVTGVRRGLKLRASPSSGGLFPSELYVVARRAEGIEAGLYHYDAETERLERLGGAPSAERLGAPGTAEAAATVIVTSIFRRTGIKYRDRAYRYAIADAGHLVENLRVSAAHEGLAADVLARFDEQRAAAALGIDGLEEGPIVMVALRERAIPSAVGAFRPVAPPEQTAIGVTGMVHRATSLSLITQPEPAEARPLPTPRQAEAGALAVVASRRSRRRYADEALSLEAFASVLADVAQPPILTPAVRINVVVNRVAGLDPGVYRYGAGHELAVVRSGAQADRAQSAALSQEVIGDAAAVLILSVDREAMFAAGARGYRLALLEAGMMGERWALSAVARELAACPVGAFYDDEASALIGVDPERQWVLHFAALGLPDG